MASQLKSQDLGPMKETLHSSTVLPRLGTSRTESLQNLHIHMVDSVTKLLGNNIVLKEHPLPILDKEQRTNRRQLCTLSQLRSGHCHLLYEYKHRVFVKPRHISTDCGASPQDVRHLFVCRTRTTDLLPEDLWQNGLESGNNKPFWKYVKSKKQETFGISALKSNGNVITDSLSKAEILNSQFKLVITPQSGNTFPQLPGTQCPKIKHLHISENGVSCY